MKDIKFNRNSKVQKKVDISKIKKKAEEHKYKTYADLRDDFSTFIGNILATSQSASVEDAASKLLQLVDDEIASITTCNSCYQLAFKHRKTSFTMVCPEPHLLIWAKPPEYNYWPAKLMKICQDDEQKVNVRFFGDHTVYDLPVSDCLLYSATNPDAIDDKSLNDGYDMAVKVSIPSSDFSLKKTSRSKNCEESLLRYVIKHCFSFFSSGSQSIHQKCDGNIWCFQYLRNTSAIRT